MKRLRVFAGPNGSGKSTMIGYIQKFINNMGIYVNADDIKREIDISGILNLNNYDIFPAEMEINKFFAVSTMLEKSTISKDDYLKCFKLKDNQLFFENSNGIDGYFAATLADFIRENLLASGKSISMETVMSHPSKLEFVKKAKDCGYKTYLYFITLADPTINVDRVKQRKGAGGHDVPEDKILKRYYNTMNLLMPAINLFDKSYLFDNSTTERIYVASVENSMLKYMQEVAPQWINDYILKKK